MWRKDWYITCRCFCLQTICDVWYFVGFIGEFSYFSITRRWQKGQWCCPAGKVTPRVVECIDSLSPIYDCIASQIRQSMTPGSSATPVANVRPTAGFLCCWPVGLELTAGQFERPEYNQRQLPQTFENTLFALYWSIQRIRGFTKMRYTNLLTYLLTYIAGCLLKETGSGISSGITIKSYTPNDSYSLTSDTWSTSPYLDYPSATSLSVSLSSSHSVWSHCTTGWQCWC